MKNIKTSKSETLQHLKAEQQERAYDEHIREMKRKEAARLFAQLFWPVPQTLAWIAFREEACLDNSLPFGPMPLIRDEIASRGEAPSAAWYTTNAVWPIRATDPQVTLLRALQDGSIPALKDGNELPREAWAGANGRDWPIVHFRREDVLALWPVGRERVLANALAQASTTKTGPNANAQNVPVFGERRRGPRPKKLERVKTAMRDDISQKGLTLADLQEIPEKDLAETYGVSRDTARKARNTILAEIAANSISDK